MTDYYDLILGLIPLALLGLTALLTTAGLGLTTAVPLAASVSVALIGHAMFVNGPVDGADENAQASRSQVGPVNAD
jgi:Flp pilus assembly pilin Flp